MHVGFWCLHTLILSFVHFMFIFWINKQIKKRVLESYSKYIYYKILSFCSICSACVRFRNLDCLLEGCCIIMLKLLWGKMYLLISLSLIILIISTIYLIRQIIRSLRALNFAKCKRFTQHKLYNQLTKQTFFYQPNIQKSFKYVIPDYRHDKVLNSLNNG